MSIMDSILSEEGAFEKLSSIGQENLLAHWNSLSQLEKENLRAQITSIDLDQFRRQTEKIACPEKEFKTFTPFQWGIESGNKEDYERGFLKVKKGKCACLVLAGGQGSRLKCEGPKGVFPISNAKGKSLFQLIAEKVKAAGEQAERFLPIAFMTSPLNHVETEAFFSKNSFFGLSPHQVDFFHQEMWPALNFAGNLFLENPGQIAFGPNGNGSFFRNFVQSGLWDRWNREGIEYVNLIQIDNPLALPFDYELIGYHDRRNNDVTVKSAYRLKPHESVGVLVESEGKAHVVEYSELSESEKNATTEEGILKHRIANIGLFCFSMSFIQKEYAAPLPLHFAKKAFKYMDLSGKTQFPEVANAWKFEEFIFDILPFANRCEALIFPREECFAPLKNLEGEDSIKSVQSALATWDRKTIFKVSGVAVPSQKVIEISADFYYPKKTLIQQWKGKALPNQDYIEAE